MNFLKVGDLDTRSIVSFKKNICYDKNSKITYRYINKNGLTLSDVINSEVSDRINPKLTPEVKGQILFDIFESIEENGDFINITIEDFIYILFKNGYLKKEINDENPEFFRQFISFPGFGGTFNRREFKSIMESIENNNLDQMEKSKFLCQKIENIQKSLIDNIKPQKFAEPIIEKKTIVFNFGKFSGISYLFDKIFASKNVPFIIFNNGTNVLRKIFDDNKLNIKKCMIKKDVKINNIYFTIVFDKQKDILRSHFFIDEKDELVMKIKNVSNNISSNDIIKLITNNVLYIISNNPTIEEIDISAKIYKRYTPIDRITFIYFITNNPIGQLYFFLNEITNPYGLKSKKEDKIAKLYMKNGIFMDKNKSISKSSPAVFDLSIKKGGGYINDIERNIPPGENYILINVNKVKNKEDIKLFSNVINLILDFYSDIRDSIIGNINSIFPGISFNEKINDEYIDYDIFGSIDRYNRLEVLKKMSNDAFSANYARSISQKGNQPYVISDNELNNYLNIKNTTIEALENDLRILKFILIDSSLPYIWLTCDTEILKTIDVFKNIPPSNLSVISLKKNNLSTNDKYPYLPSCFVRDLNGNFKNSHKQNYILYKNYISTGQVIHNNKQGTANSSHILQTLKIAGENVFGNLPPTISKIIKSVTGEEFAVRYGVIGSNKSSLLHCISFVADPYYIRLGIKDRIEYIDNLRSVLDQNNIFINSLMQENYDVDVSEIKENIINKDIFFDSKLYYRLLEILFDVNIFIFGFEGIGKNTKTFMEIPRNKYGHLRYLNKDAPTIIIFRNSGTERDRKITTDDNYELIVAGERVAFGEDVTEKLYNILYETNDLIEWSVRNNNIVRNKFNNYYDLFNENLNQSAFSQLIDDFGKCRGFNFVTKYGLSTVIVPPCQPVNLPSFTINEIKRIKVDNAIDIYGKPLFRTKNNDGLWFNFVNNEMIYVPTVGKINSKIPIGEDSPFIKESDYCIEDNNRIEFFISLINKLLEWLYITGIKNKNIKTYSDFEKYIKIVNIKEYNFTNIPYLLPTCSGVSDGIKKMNKYVPTLFDKHGKILLINENMKKKVIFNLKMLDRQIGGLEIIDDNISESKILELIGTKIIDDSLSFLIKENRIDIKYKVLIDSITREFSISRAIIPSKLNILYKDNFHYKKHKNNLLFINDIIYDEWLKQNRIDIYSKYQDLNIVCNNITLDMVKNKDPFVYMVFGIYYLIQNVSDGSYYTAVSIAAKWKLDKVNVGNSYNEIVDHNFDIVEYYLTNIGKPMRVNSDKIGKDYIEIMNYGNDDDELWCAMLPL